MKCEVAKKIVMSLELNEAIWLKNYLQNGLPDEDKIDSKNREKFFESLKSSLIDADVIPML